MRLISFRVSLSDVYWRNAERTPDMPGTLAWNPFLNFITYIFSSLSFFSGNENPTESRKRFANTAGMHPSHKIPLFPSGVLYLLLFI